MREVGWERNFAIRLQTLQCMDCGVRCRLCVLLCERRTHGARSSACGCGMWQLMPICGSGIKGCGPCPVEPDL